MTTRRYGRIAKTHTIPYGTLAGAPDELRIAYYYYGYKNDDDLPPLPVVEPDPIDYYDPNDTDPRLDTLLACVSEPDLLTSRERQLMTMRFLQEMTLEECGTYMQVTRERIRQIEAKMLRKLKRAYWHKERRYGY